MTRTIVALSGLAVALSACGWSDPDPVYMKPIYDKIGNASCMGSYQIAITQAGETICVPT